MNSRRWLSKLAKLVVIAVLNYGWLSATAEEQFTSDGAIRKAQWDDGKEPRPSLNGGYHGFHARRMAEHNSIVQHLRDQSDGC
jgi:hypothetical protein